MNNVNFTDMNLKLNTNTIVIPDTDIEVLQYLPIEDKNALIQLSLQNSDENGVYNIVKLNMYSELYLVYLYTNIQFTAEQKMNASETYDILKSNGIISTVISAIPSSEYEYLCDALETALKYKMKYRNTVAATINNFIENLPINAQEAMNIIDKFNPETFQRVIDFAQAANGGRPIN